MENSQKSVYNSAYGTWITRDSSMNHSETGSRVNFGNDRYELYESPYGEPYCEEEMGSPSDEQVETWLEEDYRKKRNVTRDEKGRLMNQSKLAKKRCCDEDEIWFKHHNLNMGVKEIVEVMGCSKSTVYNVLKKYRGQGENGD